MCAHRQQTSCPNHTRRPHLAAVTALDEINTTVTALFADEAAKQCGDTSAQTASVFLLALRWWLWWRLLILHLWWWVTLLRRIAVGGRTWRRRSVVPVGWRRVLRLLVVIALARHGCRETVERQPVSMRLGGKK